MAGAVVARDTLRGLVIPDDRLFSVDTLDSTYSTYTQAGPRVGAAVAQDDSAMTIDTSGTQSAGGTLEIQTQRAGMPSGQHASFVWRGSASESWRGWNPPWIFDDWAWIHRSTTAGFWKHPHTITLSDGTLLTVATSESRYVKSYNITTANATTAATVFDYGSAGTYSWQPCLVALPSGRILCFFWYEITSTSFQMRMHYTDDNGATWSTGAKAVLPATLGAQPRRIRAAYANNQILMLCWRTNGTDETLIQYASADLGCSFAEIETRTDTDRGYPDVVVVDNVFVCAYLGGGLDIGSTATYVPNVVRVASAYQALSTAERVLGVASTDSLEWATVAGSVFTDGDLMMALDEDGCLYLVGREVAADQKIYLSLSTDGGISWSRANTNVFTLWADTGTYLTQLSGSFTTGRLAIVSINVTAPGTSDPSLSIVWGGGYTSQPGVLDTTRAPDPIQVSGWDVVYAPFDLPDNLTTWTLVTTGAPTATLTSSGLLLASTSPDKIYYEATPAISHASGCDVEARLNPDTSVSYLEIRVSDATPLQYQVRFSISTSAITIYDIEAGATVGSVSATFGAGIRIRLSIKGSAIVAAYRTTSTDWTEISCSALTSAASNDGDRIRWGNIAGGTSSVTWRYVAYNVGDSIVGRTSPNDLLGRWYSPTPMAVYDGVKIAAKGGPTYQAEGWDIAARYDYPIDQLFTTPYPSRRQAWRSASVDPITDPVPQQTISWLVSPQVVGEQTLQTPLMAIGLFGCNFPAAEVWGKTLLGSWTKIGDISLTLATGLKYTRSGNRLVCDTSGGASINDYLYRNALKGCHFKLATGQIRTIEANSDGVWNASATASTARITLSDAVTTDDTSGSGGQIWLRDVIALVPFTTPYAYIKLVIPTAVTSEGYFTCKAMMGSAYVWGSEYGNPWARELMTYVDVNETRTGVRSMRQRAPSRYAVEVSWPDWIDTSGTALAEPPTPDWVVGWTSGSPVANFGDTPLSVPGLIEELDGATTPIAVFRGATLPATSSTVSMVKNPALVVYGHIVTDTLRADNVFGREDKDAAMRVGTVRVEELT